MSSAAQAHRKDILQFLATNKELRKINFSFRGFKVYPSAYYRDVHDAILKNRIGVEIDWNLIRSGVDAKYVHTSLINWGDNVLRIPPTFGIRLIYHQAILIHECTHAHIDIQNIGWHFTWMNEAIAYLADAIYLQAIAKKIGVRVEKLPWGKADLMTALPSTSKPANPKLNRIMSIRKVALSVASKMLAGRYHVSDADVLRLIKVVRLHPAYRSDILTKSDGV